MSDTIKALETVYAESSKLLVQLAAELEQERQERATAAGMTLWRQATQQARADIVVLLRARADELQNYSCSADVQSRQAECRYLIRKIESMKP